MKTIIVLSAPVLSPNFSRSEASIAGKVQIRYTIIQDFEEKYHEITVAEIPEPIQNTLSKEYSGYKTDKVFKGENRTFKLAVSKEEMKAVFLFNTMGEVLKSDRSIAGN